MVQTCVAVNCTYRYKAGSGIGLFRFPKDVKRKQLWTNAVRRKDWNPTSVSRICGKHFQTGKPSRDKKHPDYVPNVFSYASESRSVELYEKRRSTIEKREKLKFERESVKSAIDGLLLLAQGHQSEEQMECEADSVDQPIECDIQEEEPRDENNEAELQELREKIKIYENKINILSTENMVLRNTVNCMDKEIRLLREERNIWHQKALSLYPTEIILNNNEFLNLYTGLPSVDLFNFIVLLLGSDISDHYLSKETQLLIVLMKIKLNLLSSDLACRFQISRTTVRRIFDKLIPLLGGKLQKLIVWPQKKNLRRSCPIAFKNTEYQDAVCIIDCTEVPIERPSNQIARSQTWSNYKNSQTVKFLVASIPSGGISFVSKAWGGRTSDKEIALQSGFLEKISDGDLVLADRGFNVEEYFKVKGAKLVVPSFTKGKKQLSKQEIIYSKKLSNVRIHIERVIRQIKRFRILQNKIPIVFAKHVDNIIIICAALSNLVPSVVN